MPGREQARDLPRPLQPLRPCGVVHEYNSTSPSDFAQGRRPHPKPSGRYAGLLLRDSREPGLAPPTFRVVTNAEEQRICRSGNSWIRSLGPRSPGVVTALSAGERTQARLQARLRALEQTAAEDRDCSARMRGPDRSLEVLGEWQSADGAWLKAARYGAGGSHRTAERADTMTRGSRACCMKAGRMLERVPRRALPGLAR